MRIIYSLFLIFISLISAGVFGASTPDEWMSRAELTAQLSALRCEDCLTPSAEMVDQFSADRLVDAKKDPTLSLDDLTTDMYS